MKNSQAITKPTPRTLKDWHWKDVLVAEGGFSHACNSTNFRWLLEQHRAGNPNWGVRVNLLHAEPLSATTPQIHPRTADLVQRFAAALTEKLAAAEAKYGYSDNWASPDWMDECRAKLLEHVAKGDPRDVAAYCAFLWHHGEGTAMPTSQPHADAEPRNS